MKKLLLLLLLILTTFSCALKDETTLELSRYGPTYNVPPNATILSQSDNGEWVKFELEGDTFLFHNGYHSESLIQLN